MVCNDCLVGASLLLLHMVQSVGTTSYLFLLFLKPEMFTVRRLDTLTNQVSIIPIVCRVGGT